MLAERLIRPALERDPDHHLSRRNLARLTAVREDHLIRLPADLMHRPGPRLLDGAQLLCERLAAIPDPGLP